MDSKDHKTTGNQKTALILQILYLLLRGDRAQYVMQITDQLDQSCLKLLQLFLELIVLSHRSCCRHLFTNKHLSVKLLYCKDSLCYDWNTTTKQTVNKLSSWSSYIHAKFHFKIKVYWDFVTFKIIHNSFKLPTGRENSIFMLFQ